MGGLFSKKKAVWVPVNEKLAEKLETYKQWDAKTSFIGWKVCNDGTQLCKAIANTNTVSELDLSFNGLGDKEIKELAIAIKENANKNQGPKDEGKLQELGTFKKINLSNNHIHFQRDELKGGIAALTRVLMDDKVRKPGFSEFSLRELNLANNYLGPEGATEIAKVLKGNRYLMRVDLSWYEICHLPLDAFIDLAPDVHTSQEQHWQRRPGSDPREPAPFPQVGAHQHPQQHVRPAAARKPRERMGGPQEGPQKEPRPGEPRRRHPRRRHPRLDRDPPRGRQGLRRGTEAAAQLGTAGTENRFREALVAGKGLWDSEHRQGKHTSDGQVFSY